MENNDTLTFQANFVSGLYTTNKQEYLTDAKKVYEKYIERQTEYTKGVSEWAVTQTESMFEPELTNLMNYLAQTSWNILDSQGYDMNLYNTQLTEFWGQRIDKGGYHFEHVHPNAAQITGFYFLEVPEDSCRVVLYDPRAGKKQLSLREKDWTQLTYACDSINFTPKAGDIYFINSWQGHGFSMNQSDKPFKFIHFNVATVEVPPQNMTINTCVPQAEII